MPLEAAFFYPIGEFSGLGSEIFTVRLGGIFALQRLSLERAQDYHLEIARLLCSFVRRTSGETKEDVQAAMDFLKSRPNRLRKIEDRADYVMDLSGANLAGLNLSHGDLSKTIFDSANFSNASLVNTKLNGCSLV